MIRSVAPLAALLAVFTTPYPVPSQEAPRPVELMVVEPPSGELTRRFFGKVVARQTVDLAFQTAGQIVHFPAVEGRLVPAGETIARLDREPFRLALERARLEWGQADRHAQRQQSLQDRAASRVSVEDAVTDSGIARVALREARRHLEHATLAAPFDALVARCLVATFTTVRAGEAVVRLHDLSEFRIEIEVPEILFQRTGRDPDVSIAVQFPASERQFSVEVREYRAETSRIGQTFRVTFAMAPREDLHVLPGSSATVIASLQRRERRIAVPASAVVLGAHGAASVMVFRADGPDEGVVTAQPVTLAVGSDGALRVEEGLSPGMEIVAAGAGAPILGARGLSAAP